MIAVPKMQSNKQARISCVKICWYINWFFDDRSRSTANNDKVGLSEGQKLAGLRGHANERKHRRYPGYPLRAGR
jgi:hypothetical protein